MGRDEPKRRRAHLFAVVETMTRQGSQGETQGETTAQAATVAHLCASAGLSRASDYRGLEPRLGARDDADLRGRIQRLALQRRFEGYRRITRRLRDEGLIVNAKRVLRLMRADNLLSLRRNPFVPPTTMSRHPHRIVPNRARWLIPSGLDQVWVAYVRLTEGFVYLAVVIDAFSRKAVGWAVEDHLEARLALQALDMAIAARDPPGGLIHHSDRGVQYVCHAYAARLEERSIEASMSRPGNPYDNAKAESFMKTLKAEEADGQAYRDLAHARSRLADFIDNIDNADRLHSALGYKSPTAFETDFRNKDKRIPETLTPLAIN